MFNKFKRVALLFILTLLVVSSSVLLAACEDEVKDNGVDKDAKITYSVTVTSEVEDVDLTKIKAQWLLSNSDVAASEAIALDEHGKASVELDQTSYTVILIGVPSNKATFMAKNVTALSPHADILLTAVSVSLTQLEAPKNVKVANGVLTWSSVQNADGYTVYQDGEEVAAVNKITLKYEIPADLEDGTYLYTVVSNGDGVHYADSEKSLPAKYTVGEVSDEDGAALEAGAQITVEVPQYYNSTVKTVTLNGLEEGKEYIISLSELSVGLMNTSFTITYNGQTIVLDAANEFTATFTAASATTFEIKSGSIGDETDEVKINLAAAE